MAGEIEETSPPELNLVFDVWASILRPFNWSLPLDYFAEKTANYLKRVTKESSPLNLADAMLKRRFLKKNLVCFLCELYGANWSDLVY